MATEFFVCCVRDRKAEFFFPPWFLRNQVEAMRAFERVMHEPQRVGDADDYELFELGTFDDESGKFSLLPLPRSLAYGSQVLKKE